MDNFRFSTVMLQKILPKTILTWDPIFKGLVTTLQVRYWLEICCHGHAVKTLFNEAYAKFDSSCYSVIFISIFQKARTQEVIIEGSKSTPSPVSSGVPQGSSLVPSLY